MIDSIKQAHEMKITSTTFTISIQIELKIKAKAEEEVATRKRRYNLTTVKQIFLILQPDRFQILIYCFDTFKT
jgi:hypothetical protein